MSTTTETLEQALERYKRWVSDLQAGCYVNCVYCGHRYGHEDDTPVVMADVLKRHIAECPAHPLARAVMLLEMAYHSLRSYQFGNAAEDPAWEGADLIDKFLSNLKAT